MGNVEMTTGTEMMFDPEEGSVVMVNETSVPDNKIIEAVIEQAPEVAALTRWTMSNQGRSSRRQSLFDRDMYMTPKNIFEEFRLASYAAEYDDVVSNVIETTEQIAFKRIGVEAEDTDEENIWGQIIQDLDLTNRMKEIWRELFTVSQCYVAVMYGRRSYRVNGKTQSGNKRKRQFNDLRVPTGITLLDPLKVIPIGNFMFNQEKLVYIADRDESTVIHETLAGRNTSDLIVTELLLGPYRPTQTELNEIRDITGASLDGRLFLLNPERVWRINSTRPQYQRFANVRMKSIFELLDMKAQLRQMDRAHIIGSTNFIILVKKGSDSLPAKPAEIAQLAGQVKTASRVPIIVGDHRIEIEIITPKMDKTLDPGRYNSLDSRITARLYQILNNGNNAGSSGDDSMKLLKVIASSIEARRNTIRDSIMKHLIMPTYMVNDSLTTEPKMAFYPRRVALHFDPNIATYMQDLRDRGDISRETILAELDIIESDEARKREREAEQFDHIFTPVHVPFSPVLPTTDPYGTKEGEAVPSDMPVEVPGNTRGVGRRGGGRTGGSGTSRDSFRSNPTNQVSGASIDLDEESDDI